MEFVKENDLGGVAVNTLDMDDFQGAFCNKGPFPFLKASLALLGNTSSNNTTTKTTSPTTTTQTTTTTTKITTEYCRSFILNNNNVQLMIMIMLLALFILNIMTNINLTSILNQNKNSHI